MHRDSGAKGTHRLQNVSSEAEETSETSGGPGSGAVGSTSEGWLGDNWGDGADSGGGWSNLGNNWDGGVDIDWGRWLNNWLGDGAWAVRDGEGGGLGDGVGDTVEAQGGWAWAVSGVGGVDLSNIGDVAGGSDGGHEGSGDGGVRELHLDGLDWYYLLVK